MWRPPDSAPPSGHLAGLSALINSSQRMQARGSLAAEVQGSPVVQAQLKIAEWMNTSAPTGSDSADTTSDGTLPVQMKAAPAPSPSHTGLPNSLKAGVENLSGLSLDGVKVHYNSARPAQLSALAYAQGTDIHVAPGQEKHLPHEAWHVVQQAQGRVEPTMQMRAGVAVNDDAALEHEADVMGAQAAGHETRHIDQGNLTPMAAPQTQVAQGKWFRMSTLLDPGDELEVAEIQQLADRGDLFNAFWKVISKSEELLARFRTIANLCSNEEIRDTAWNILWETFEEPGKAYTAGEVLQQFEDSEIITREADALAETDNPDDDIEDLIAYFSDLHISVPFRSDIDEQKEEHSVFWETGDVIVQSNPKPLKDMIAAGKWEHFVISNPQRTQLDGLRKAAKHALYKVAGNAKRNITGSRTKGNMTAFRNSLDAIAKVLSNLGGGAHAATLMPVTNLAASANHGINAAPVEGTHVKARPLCINSTTPGSQPVDGRLMKSIRNLAGNQSKSYVQMHLLNDLVFGPGELWNLTPGPKQSNVDMEQNVEDPLKRAVLGKGLVINFEAQVNYSNDPNTASNQQIAQNPDRYRFQSISFSAEQLEYDKATKTWNVSATPDPDVKKVDGKRVLWRYGSLTPLVPKPRILDPATTVADLITANIQPGAAKRIVSFVQNNPGWQPKGAHKQQQLAQAVKMFDKLKTIPNISSWKASAVLWT